jgi:hypothetical protein
MRSGELTKRTVAIDAKDAAKFRAFINKGPIEERDRHGDLVKGRVLSVKEGNAVALVEIDE